MTDEELPVYLTTTEACKRYNISYGYLNELIKSNRIAYRKDGNRAKINTDSLAAYLKSQEIRPWR
jgi:excisionase family DNA binding protein